MHFLLTFDFVKPWKARYDLHLKALLLITVYLFFSIANVFFTNKQIAAPRGSSIVKTASQGTIHIPKTNKAAVFQQRISVSQLVAHGSQFFIVLLVCSCFLIVYKKLGPVLSYSVVNRHYAYLRYCVIRI